MMNRVKICALLFSLLVLLLGCGNEMNSKELIERYETPSVNEILNEIDTVGKDNSEGIEEPSINIESEDVVNLQDATLVSNSEEVILSNNVEELIISLENYGNKDVYEQLANAEDYLTIWKIQYGRRKCVNTNLNLYPNKMKNQCINAVSLLSDANEALNRRKRKAIVGGVWLRVCKRYLDVNPESYVNRNKGLKIRIEEEYNMFLNGIF